MPRVPTRETASVGVTGAALPYQSSSAATAEAFGAVEGRAKEQLGSAIEQFGNVLYKQSVALQTRANESFAKDLFLGADVEMGQATAEYNALEGVNKVNAYGEYVKKLEGIRSKWKSQAPNVEVAHHFDNDFSRRMAYSIAGGAGQAASANRQYNKQNSVAMVNNATSDTAANADDDVRFQANMDITLKNVASLNTEQGGGEERLKELQSKAASELWMTRLHSISQLDPFRAEKLFEANKDKIGGLEQQKIIERINTQKVNIGSKIVSDAIVNGQPIPAVKAEGPFTIQQQAAIKGRANMAKPDAVWGDPRSPTFASEHLQQIQTPSGKTLQVNRVAAPYFEGFLSELEGMGYKITSVGGHNYRNIAGTGTLSQHAYGNAIDINPYSEGNGFGPRLQTNLPPNVSEIAAKWGLSWGGDWEGKKDAMHFEFVGIEPAKEAAGIKVADSSGEIISGGPGPLTPNSDSGWLQRALDQASVIAEKLAPSDPRFEQALKTQIESQYNQVKRVRQQAEQANYLTTMSAVMGDFGDKMIRDPSQIYADARLNSIFNELPVTKQQQVLAQVKRNATADVPLTPERFGKFQEIMGKSITDPQTFITTNPGEEDLPRTLQREIFTKQRQMAGKLQDTTKINTALRTVGPMLAEAGIVPMRSDPSAMATYNQFVGAFDVKLKAFEGEKKRYPNEEEQRKIAAGLLTETEGGWFFGMFGGRRDFELPSSWKDPSTGQSIGQAEWRTRFRDRYGRDPTPSEMFTIFQRSLNNAR